MQEVRGLDEKELNSSAGTDDFVAEESLYEMNPVVAVLWLLWLLWLWL